MLVQGFFVFTKRYLKDRGLKKWVTSSVLPTYVIIHLYIYIQICTYIDGYTVFLPWCP